MTEISEEFVEDQVKELKEREDVKAIAIFGSYARDPEGNHNDLDIYIIVDGNWRKRKTEVIDGKLVEKFFNSKEWAEHYLDRAEDEDNWAYPYRWFANPDVRYDPEGIFEDMTQKAEEFKENKLGEDLNEDRFLYYIWDMEQDIDRAEDVAQKRYMMFQLFDSLLEKSYKLNNKVPVKDNYRIKKLQDFDGYMYKLSQEFLMSSSTLEKEGKLEKMIEHLTRGMREPKPEWKTEKEELEQN